MSHTKIALVVAYSREVGIVKSLLHSFASLSQTNVHILDTANCDDTRSNASLNPFPLFFASLPIVLPQIELYFEPPVKDSHTLVTTYVALMKFGLGTDLTLSASLCHSLHLTRVNF